MKRFIKELFIFMIPLVLFATFFGSFTAIGYIVGEFRDLDYLIQEQRKDHSILIGMGYNEQTEYYKLVNANYYRGDVIALGTSRVMQFKDDFFCVGFYNCGGAVSGNYDEYLNFLENLEYSPQMIILGLDQWTFNDAWNRNCAQYSNMVNIEPADRNIAVMTKGIIEDWLEGKWRLNEINNYNMNYGFNGCINDNGFQWDGTYYYGETYREPKLQEDYLFADTYERIDGGYRRFEWGEDVDNETVEYLKDFLTYCKNNKIDVIGFAPPFAPSVYNKMEKSGRYDYLLEIDTVCQNLFEQYGYEYYSYMSGEKLGMGDAYFIDGFHGGEVVYAYILKDMVEHNSNICQYINGDKLSNSINMPYSTLLLEEPMHGR